MAEIECTETPWIETLDGERFVLDPNHPRTADDFDIVCIANALSKINRYTGHTPEPYSVAEHSVYVALAVPREYRLIALIHDAPEAFIGDISSPMKQVIRRHTRALDELEDSIFDAMIEAFSLVAPPNWRQVVKEADINIGEAERKHFGFGDEYKWVIETMATEKINLEHFSREHGFRDTQLPAVCWTHRTATTRFLQLFRALY